MEISKFCPNCGQEFTPGDTFCGNCGQDLQGLLDSAPVEQIEADSATISDPADFSNISTNLMGQNEEPQVTPNTAQPIVAKKSKAAPVIISLLVLAAVLAGGYYAGSNYYSQSKQAATLRDEAVSGNSAKMKQALIGTDGKSLSTAQIDALKRLYLKDPQATKEIERDINNNYTQSIFAVKQTGKIFGIFNQYKIQVKAKTLFIDTNITNPAFLINNKNVSATHVAGEYRIAQLTPGVYDLKVDGSSDSKAKQVQVSAAIKDDTAELNVEEKSETDDFFATDSNSDADTGTQDDSESTDNSNSESSTKSNVKPAPASVDSDSMVGTYHGSPDLTLNSDGTYRLGSKSGTYTIDKDGSSVDITYHQNGGGTITESYDYDGSELYSPKYSQGWTKY